jgi:cold shock CspA family protein
MHIPLPLLAWRQADDDVYVATHAGEYAGFTDATPHGVRAHGPRGEDLGIHATADHARAAVASLASPSLTPAAAHIRPRRIRGRGAPGCFVGPKNRKDAITGEGSKALREDQKVEFDAERGPKGMQAANIRPS